MTFNKDIYWLLKDKYNLSPTQISKLEKDESLFSYEMKLDLERLETDEPINYIIGWQEFLGCKIDLRFRPLIPRVETEFWVKNVIDNIINKTTSSNIKILDLGCGSGCIGISLLKHLSNCHVTFADISDDAINQTELNLQINKLKPRRFKFIKSDLFESITGKFDYIFCNPPYVDPNGLVPASLNFEPDVALFSNDNGLETAKRFLETTYNFLNPDGTIYMEFGYKQEDFLVDFLNKLNKYKLDFLFDQYNVKRTLKLDVL